MFLKRFVLPSRGILVRSRGRDRSPATEPALTEATEIKKRKATLIEDAMSREKALTPLMQAKRLLYQWSLKLLLH